MSQFDSLSLKRVGVYTSGGDAPGMNAAIRAVVRSAIFHRLEIVGWTGGYAGLLSGAPTPLSLNSVANILQRGGTILKTGRLGDFHKTEVRAQTAHNIRAANVQALICIGGDGSFHGAHLLGTEHALPVVGVPATIDNDINGTDLTIGFDTASNTAVEAVDRIRDTADSHDRLFIIEVMGRDSGFLAVDVGLACGAEEVFFPENPVTVETAIEHIRRGMARGKSSSILITAEGQKPGRAYNLAEAIRKKAGFDAKVCILGHIQRGGSPTANDRILASRLGAFAIETLRAGQCDVMAAVQNDTLVTVPFATALKQKKRVRQELIRLAQILSS